MICTPAPTIDGASEPIVFSRFDTSVAPWLISSGTREAMPLAKFDITCGPFSCTMARMLLICSPNFSCRSPSPASAAPIIAAGMSAFKAIPIIVCRPLASCPPTAPTALPITPPTFPKIPVIFPSRLSSAKVCHAVFAVSPILERPVKTCGNVRDVILRRVLPASVAPLLSPLESTPGKPLTAPWNSPMPATPAFHRPLSRTVLTVLTAISAPPAAAAFLNPSGSLSSRPETSLIAPVIPPASNASKMLPIVSAIF